MEMNMSYLSPLDASLQDLACMLGIYDTKDITTVEVKNKMPIIKINKEMFINIFILDEWEIIKCLLYIFRLITDAIHLHPIQTNIWICDIWEDGNDNKLIYTCYGYTKKDFKKSAYYTTYKKYKKYINTEDIILLTPLEYLTYDMYDKAKNSGFENYIQEYDAKN